MTHQKLHNYDEIVANRVVLLALSIRPFPSARVYFFFKCSQGTAVKSPSHKAPWYPALRHSHTVSSLLSLRVIPPPSDHLALRHCGGKCSYSLASHSSLREQWVERQEPWREKIKKKKKLRTDDRLRVVQTTQARYRKKKGGCRAPSWPFVTGNMHSCQTQM